MKMILVIRLSEHWKDGYYISVEPPELRPVYENEPTCKVIGEIDVPVEQHYAWMVDAADDVAKGLMEAAQVEYERNLSRIKEFESKFLLLGAPPLVTDTYL
jgi:hypothetical protein